MNILEQKIALIGLGYVGLQLSVEFGRRRPVLGFDINKRRIAELRSGKDSTLEVTCQDLEVCQIKYSYNEEDLKECGIFIIAVPTPTDIINRPDLGCLIEASEIAGRALKTGGLVIYESTVYPGCTEEICVPILEKKSGLKFNVDFFCGYSPERISPGDKTNKLTSIKKITSGSNPEVANAVDKLYGSIIKAGTHKTSSLKVAEAAKVVENSQRDLNIAFVNELSPIFGRLGIDTMEVLKAAGSKWNFLPFYPGIVGGHCIGIDPYYLIHKAEEIGYRLQLLLASRQINNDMVYYIAKNIIQLMLKNEIDVVHSTVGIMGFTFKEDCPDIRNSKVFDLVKELRGWSINVVVSDPWADPEEVMEKYGIALRTIDEAYSVDSLIVAVGHGEYRSFTPSQLRRFCKAKHPVLADIKLIYDPQEAVDSGFTVFRL